jgi:hypothetical protein
MSIFILPTCDLVTECQTYDNLFRLFVPGGVKSIVKDAVHMTSFKERSPVMDYHRSLQHHSSALTDYVLKRYDDYTTQKQILQMDEHGGDLRGQFDLSQYMGRTGEIEMITQWIEQMVELMMEDLFKTRLFHIVEQSSRWMDRDLVVRVETLANRWGNRHAL